MEHEPVKKLKISIDDKSTAEKTKKEEKEVDEPIGFDGNRQEQMEQPIDNIQDGQDDNDEQGLKIVHLKEDCLEKIFHQLNIADLINVAEANIFLATIAERVVSQLFQHNRLDIILKGHLKKPAQWHLSTNVHYVTVNFDIVQKLFELFGKHLRKLKVFFTPFGCRGNEEYTFFRVLGENCCNSLLEIECRGNSMPCILKNFQKPFVRLEKLIFSEIFTCSSLNAMPINRVSDVFPNLRFLEFQNVRHVFLHFCVQRIPKLEHFGIYTHPYATFEKEYFTHIHQLSVMNPQLISLGMYDIQESNDDLQLVPMPNITRLEIGELYLHPSPPFLFDNVTHMRITYFGRGSSEWRTLPPRVTHLELAGFHVNDNLARLSAQLPELISLTLIVCENFDINYVHEIAESLPRIKEIEIIAYFEDDPDTILAFTSVLIFMQKCALLRKAVATVRVNKTEAKFIINHWTFDRADEILAVYQAKLEKALVLNWWQWPMKHEVRIIDYIKGWRSEPSFQVSMVNSTRNGD